MKNWKLWLLGAAVIVVSVFVASYLKEQFDTYRLKKAMGGSTDDVPMTQSTASGQLLSPIR